MWQLFDMDEKNYDPLCRRFVRPSARGILIKGRQIELVYVSSLGYYKFPGGGIDPGEDRLEALCREVKEEAGLTVIPGSIREYGMVHRIEFHAEHGDIFDQENFYYLCEAEPQREAPAYTDDETREGFRPVLADPAEAVRANRTAAEAMMAKAVGFDRAYAVAKEICREGRVLELLIREGFFKD